MNPLNAYKNTSVNTAPPGRLLVMLYDGLVRFAEQAREAMRAEDIETAHKKLVRCQDIVLELRSTLDHDKSPELCDNLEALYTYMYTKLVDANRTKNINYLDEVLPMMTELRDAFSTADRLSTSEGQG